MFHPSGIFNMAWKFLQNRSLHFLKYLAYLEINLLLEQLQNTKFQFSTNQRYEKELIDLKIIHEPTF